MDWSYIAGFFDGEGNLYIARSRSFKNGNVSHYITIRIYQDNIDVLEQIKQFLGFGQIYKYTNKTAELSFNKKKDVQSFLMNIRDKIVVKKQQVDYILNNFTFERESNMGFNIDEFRKLIARRNVQRKHHTISEKSL